MGLFGTDHLASQLDQLAAMAVAIAQSTAAGHPREALALIDEAREALAGPIAVSLALFDVTSVVSILGPEKARMHARLLHLEAQALTALGSVDKARGRAAWARTIERVVDERACDVPPVTMDVAGALR